MVKFNGDRAQPGERPHLGGLNRGQGSEYVRLMYGGVICENFAFQFPLLVTPYAKATQ